MKILLNAALMSAFLAITASAQAHDRISWSVSVGTPLPIYANSTPYLRGPAVTYVQRQPRVYDQEYTRPEVIYVNPAPRVTYIQPEPVITYSEVWPQVIYRETGPHWRGQHYRHGRWHR